MAEIVFVNYPYYDKEQNYPIGLMNLINILNNGKLDINAELIDYNQLIYNDKLRIEDFKEKNYQKLCSFILEKRPKIVGFSTIASSYDITLEIASHLKMKKPDIIIFFGGPQASVTYRETLERFPFVELISIGESEDAIENIVECLLNGGEYRKLNKVAYREDNRIKINNRIDNIELDKLPFIDLSSYKDISMINIEVGRGCPYNCYYCSTSIFWERNFRVKSIDRIVHEIKYYMGQVNINRFSFLHDLFTLNKKFVIELCNRIVEEKLKIIWGCSSRADTLDEEMVSAMYDAGCRDMFIGIESGSPRMQKVIDKNLNLEKTYDILRILYKYKIKVRTSFIFGFPEEKDEDLKLTFEYIYRIKQDFGFTVLLNRCEFYPYTKMYLRNKDSVINFLETNELMGLHNNTPSELILKNKDIFCNFFCINKIIKHPRMENFMNYYINIISYLFPNTHNIMYEQYGGYIELYELLYNFILNTEDIFSKNSMEDIGNKTFYKNFCKSFIKYTKDKKMFNLQQSLNFDLKFIDFKI